MKEDDRKARHAAVSAAAYAVVLEKGYDGASMLCIAKAAKASNETLYRWYGNKKGLFAQLVKDNALITGHMLTDAIKGQHDAFETLATVAPVFLTMLLGDRAILLNRAAAADPTGELGAAISVSGCDVVQPLFETILMQLTQPDANAEQLTQWFLGLLIGDLQIKRVIGVCPAPSTAEIDERVSVALTAFARLTGQR